MGMSSGGMDTARLKEGKTIPWLKVKDELGLQTRRKRRTGSFRAEAHLTE